MSDDDLIEYIHKYMKDSQTKSYCYTTYLTFLNYSAPKLHQGMCYGL